MPQDDLDDDVTRSDPGEDALRDLLLEKMKGAAVIEEDDGGLDSPPPAPPTDRTTISAEDGFERAERARNAPITTEKPKAAASTDPAPVSDIDAMIDAKPADAPAIDTDPSTFWRNAPVDQLLDGVPEDRREAISKRVAAGDEMLGLFRGREEELRLHGNLTPAQVTQRLLYLNTFAQTKPDEYLTWVAQQVNAEAPHEALAAAAKHLGYTLVPDGDPDEFEDEEKKALRLENARLKGGSAIGPDAPHNVAVLNVQQVVHQLRTATDADGNLKHPLFDKFAKEVAGKIMEYRRANNDQLPSVDQVSQFYSEVAPPVVAPSRKSAQPAGDTSAAQVAKPVAAKAQDAAAQTEKSKAASKMLDGSGPGSDHRPALTGDALLRSQIQAAVKKHST